MIIFKVLQAFLSPSVFILALITIGLIFLFRRKKQKIGKVLIIAGIIFYYIFSITPVADLILEPLESQYQPIQKDEFKKTNKIVLLLGREESAILRAGEVLRIYFKKYQIIISGMDPLSPERNEAKKTEQYLVERGVAPEDIILENKSRNTFESAKNVKELVGEEPFFLVTSGYHMPRSIESFKNAGTNPIPAPVNFKTKKIYNILDFFPNSKNIGKIDLAFHEYFGIIFYRLRY